MVDEVLVLLEETLRGDFSKDTEKKRTRKIIFWYDSKQEYQEFIQKLTFENTEIIEYHYNSFWIRYHIEKEELHKNIILYLPFERKYGIDNDLLDLEASNSDLLFNPDLTTIRLKNLGLEEDCRMIVNKNAKFFGNKKREAEFKSFDLEEKNKDNIDLIITAILLNIKSINEDDILKEIIKNYYQDSKKYEDLFRFGCEEFILSVFNNTFGSNVTSYKQLPELYHCLIFTYFVISLKDPEKAGRYRKYLLTKKATNVYVFINNLMRDQTMKKSFEKLSKTVEKDFGIDDLLASMSINDYVFSDAFESIDYCVIQYLVDKLVRGIGEFPIYKHFVDTRENKYWSSKLSDEYHLLKVAITFFEKVSFIISNIKLVDFDRFVQNYVDQFSQIDTLYRKMYFYFDHIEDKDLFIDLKNKIENIYIHDFMSELSIKWSQIIENSPEYYSNSIPLQSDFYRNYIKPFNDKKDRIIVIISDAFRYECAEELNDILTYFANKSEINYMQGLIPSYTKLGMASLLPHQVLSRAKDSDDILVDGRASSSINDRALILQKENPDSLALKYDDLYEMTKLEWKRLFSGKKIVYIYHDTVDRAGEYHENEIFAACDRAIKELEKLVRDLHTTFSGINAFITADHGFFYKRGKVEGYEKIDKIMNVTKQKTRYSYSDDQSNQKGVLSLNMDYVFGKNSGYVNIPKGNIIFSRPGSGINYIHGGILPQEIIIPVINFKSTRTSEESSKVGITYSGLSTRITNSITYLEFLQDHNIDTSHRPCRYLLHFEDDFGNKISDECTIIANYENTEVKDRFFREKFVFKNKQYDKTKTYYLVIIDEESGVVKDRIKFFIDISLINNFEF